MGISASQADGMPRPVRIERADDGASGAADGRAIRVRLGPARHCDRLDVTVPQITVSAPPGLARARCLEDGYAPVLEILPRRATVATAQDGVRARIVEVTAHFE